MKSFEFTAIKIFEKYSFSREDAEALVETIKEAKSDELATKIDVLKIEKEIQEIKKEIQEFKKEIQELKKDNIEIRKDIRHLDVKIESSKNSIILWVFSMMLAMSSLIIAILKFT